MKSSVTLLATLFVAFSSYSAEMILKNPETCTTGVQITGAIGPATDDYLKRGFEQAARSKCGSLLLVVNTPGGELESTRRMVEQILNSPIPVLCFVSPQGAHAGSAGAIFLQACHVIGAEPTTAIGAATPIMATGQDIAKDIRRKVINDTVAWVTSLAEKRHRNVAFAKDIVEQAKSVSSSEAQKIGAIDFLSPSIEDFLKQASGRAVEVKGVGPAQKVQTGRLEMFEQDLRYRSLALITDPQYAYLLFMGSLGLLYFEATHPGAIVPGVLGSMGLIVSMIAFQKLDVSWGGFALLILGIVFFVLELAVTNHGVLGVAGLISFTLGALYLFDPAKIGYSLPLSMILPTVVLIGGLMVTVAYLSLQARRSKKNLGADSIVGQSGIVKTVSTSEDETRGQVEIAGELWTFVSSDSVAVSDRVKVTALHGLHLRVKKYQVPFS